MVTEKKNQHYVPKFYLRNFSFQGNEHEIGIYNLFNKKYIQRAKLKTQGKKKFFYGRDGGFEDKFMNIEDIISHTIRNIICEEKISKNSDEEHINLLLFVSSTDLRNPIKMENMDNVSKLSKEQILKLIPNIDFRSLPSKLEHEQCINFALSNLGNVMLILLDLDYKLLINQTSIPFITSDCPVVKYNQFLEQKKHSVCKTGYRTTGLQIFVPLNHKIALVFYDTSIYKIGTRKQGLLLLTDKKEVEQLNILQFLNCYSTIYFDEKVPESYIKILHKKSLKYKKANKFYTQLGFVIDEREDKSEVLNSKENSYILNKSDCDINLNINGIKIHSKGKKYNVNSRVLPLRRHLENL